MNKEIGRSEIIEEASTSQTVIKSWFDRYFITMDKSTRTSKRSEMQYTLKRVANVAVTGHLAYTLACPMAPVEPNSIAKQNNAHS